MEVVPCGDYYRKKDAVKLIEDNISLKKHREKMLRLIELVPTKKSLYLAQKEMNDRNIEKIIAMFAKISVSPVTISKRQRILNYFLKICIPIYVRNNEAGRQGCVQEAATYVAISE
jgi:sulfur transfer complex TusBCD TusB component (DsrH family)